MIGRAGVGVDNVDLDAATAAAASRTSSSVLAQPTENRTAPVASVPIAACGVITNPRLRLDPSTPAPSPVLVSAPQAPR